MLAWSALTWVIIIPATLCWPAAGYVVYLVWRSAKRHDARVQLERDQGLARDGLLHDGDHHHR